MNSLGPRDCSTDVHVTGWGGVAWGRVAMGMGMVWGMGWVVPGYGYGKGGTHEC